MLHQMKQLESSFGWQMLNLVGHVWCVFLCCKIVNEGVQNGVNL